ncbi:MAG: hypothetical protein A2W17_00525 [Planctomycetes bacterium RBG_16_41_13]|nr:MAG: hypothetical protein A2W17_00525 [Planctomycetes bacterium RBG_16_41_13]
MELIRPSANFNRINKTGRRMQCVSTKTLKFLNVNLTKNPCQNHSFDRGFQNKKTPAKGNL